MEQVTFRVCDYNGCPSVTFTGKDVAKIALVTLSIVVVIYAVSQM
jgi:hypothetical protein